MHLHSKIKPNTHAYTYTSTRHIPMPNNLFTHMYICIRLYIKIYKCVDRRKRTSYRALHTSIRSLGPVRFARRWLLLYNFVKNGIENNNKICVYVYILLQHTQIHIRVCAYVQGKHRTHVGKHAKLHIYASSWCWHIVIFIRMMLVGFVLLCWSTMIDINGTQNEMVWNLPSEKRNSNEQNIGRAKEIEKNECSIHMVHRHIYSLDQLKYV